jgi:gliding motility-associated-like protein
MLNCIKHWGLLLTILVSNIVNGQHEYDNWYFGKYSAINFSTSPPRVKKDNAMFAGIAATSISDKNTGELLFYTDGSTVWNKNNVAMKNSYMFDSTYLSRFSDVIIIPFLHNTKKYHIYARHWIDHVIYSYTVDMSLDNGLGALIENQVSTRAFSSNAFFTTKHAIDSSYWLVTYYPDSDSDFFFAYKVNDSGISSKPITSKHKSNPQLQRVGEITTTSNGSKIAITYYDLNKAAVQVYDFDKQCGTVGFPIKLSVDSNWTQALGVSFSPDDTKLYVTVSPSPSYLIQYYGSNFSQWQIIDSSKSNFNGIRLGPDNRLYISLNDNANHDPSSRIDVLLYPDKLGNNTGYTPNYLDLGTNKTSNYRFPSLIYDKSPWGNTLTNAITVTNVCLGDTSHFSINNTLGYDSVVWNFGENNQTSTQKKPIYQYTNIGNYNISANIYRCNQNWVLTKTIGIYNQPQINWPIDTTFCYADTLVLKNPFATGQLNWSNGDSAQSIKIYNAGTYWAKVILGSCTASDTIKVKQLPPILVDIGDNYTICSEDNELVKLDAGKGYEHYKWTPTGDTSQWVIVKSAGDYYVVVEDYRGCKGDDGTKVLRLCDFTFYMPTAFTPNGDGNNDVFAPVYSDITDFGMEIFNRWGEKVFETTDITKGWDGMYKNNTAPIGIYAWQLSFKGFHNKLLRNYNYKGSVNLLR